MRPIYLALTALLLDCASLEPIAGSTCGNGVVDTSTEDCDSFPPTCGKPSDGAKACRLVCDRTQAGSCPAGWGCSADGVCRQATGDLLPASAPVSGGATLLTTGDFDGDGRTDIVGGPPYGSSASARVHFFDEAANLATTVSLQVPMRLPVIKDFDRDGLDDLGFALGGRIGGAFGAVSGRRDRTFATLLFPAITIPKVDARVAVINGSEGTYLPAAQASAVLAAVRDASGNHLRSIGGDPLAGPVQLDVALPMAPGDLVGPPRTGKIYEPSQTNSVCGEVAFAYNEGASGKVLVASPCSIDPGGAIRWANSRKPQTFSVPSRIVEPGLFLGDLTYDGYDDIAVSTENGVYLAASTKTGLTAFGPFVNEKGEPLPGITLAVQDFNGDGVLDPVFPAGVLMSSLVRNGEGDAGVDPAKTQFFLTARPREGQQWVEAQVGHFNGDDKLDLLVRYADSLDCEVLGNAGDGRFTSFVVRSERPVRAIASGDFDGDRIRDVAFLESPRGFSDPAGTGELELAIAYGKAIGGPEAPRVVGRFAHARAISALRNADSAIDDLGIMESIPAADGGLPTTSLTVLFGSGERQAVAPLFLDDEAALRPYEGKAGGPTGRFRAWQPVALTAGTMLEPGRLDLLAVATGLTIDLARGAVLRPFPTGVWVAGGKPGGGLDTFREVQTITGLIDGIDEKKIEQGVYEVAVVATIGDIDTPPDGLAEIINVARSPKRETGVYVVRAPESAGGKPPRASVSLPSVAVTGADPVDLFDVNADGTPDLVLLTRSGGSRKVIVLRNDGKGSFDATPLEIPLSEEPVAFARFVTSKTEIAVVTPTHLYRATFSGAGFDVQEETRFRGENMTGVATGDFDGDGVMDLAVADSGSIRVLRQRPRLR